MIAKIQSFKYKPFQSPELLSMPFWGFFSIENGVYQPIHIIKGKALKFVRCKKIRQILKQSLVRVHYLVFSLIW